MSDEREPNDRSTERLLQRKQIAEEAGKSHPGEWGTDIRYNLKMTAVCADNGEPLCIVTDDEDVATATHIAENERLNKEADWLAKIMFFYTEECPLKMKIQDELPIPKLDECLGAWPENDYFDCVKNTPKKCWREAARKAVEEEERH